MWREREQRRFRMGEYKNLPHWFPKPLITDHFAHVDPDDHTLIAFTGNERDGERDVKVKLKVGRYITRFYPDHKAKVNEWSAKWATEYAPDEVLFARTADECEWVYTNGPYSCMASSAEQFKRYGTPMHPARILGDSDIGIAYLKRDGRVTARSLVWPDKKIQQEYSYGDLVRLDAALVKLGYKRGKFTGAKIHAVPIAKKGYVALSLDYNQTVCLVDDDKKFQIGGGSKKSFNFGQTVGHVAPSNMRYCDYLDDWLANDQFKIVKDRYWSLARIEKEAFLCDATKGYYPNDERVVLAGGTSWNRDHFNRHGIVCHGSGGNYSKDEAIELKGSWYSKSHLMSLIPLAGKNAVRSAA